LTSIMSRTELVRRRLDQEQALTAEWLRLQVAAMYEAAECMVASMDEMTDTARLHSGQPAVHDGHGPIRAHERGQRGQLREQVNGPAAVAGMDPDLASARRIVEQHGGHLRLAQARGQDATGTTVLITLPRTPALHDGATGVPRRLPRAAS
jgi:hypothetical protein